ncbi:MAG TPA: hypothetical protein VJR02_01790 [Pyrinomonadaceae bacterium]|nr:hypothetical protein [Pyrinomonadaceae bacterium]
MATNTAERAIHSYALLLYDATSAIAFRFKKSLWSIGYENASLVALLLMKVIDYNGKGFWSVEEVLRRYTD